MEGPKIRKTTDVWLKGDVAWLCTKRFSEQPHASQPAHLRNHATLGKRLAFNYIYAIISIHCTISGHNTLRKKERKKSEI